MELDSLDNPPLVVPHNRIHKRRIALLESRQTYRPERALTAMLRMVKNHQHERARCKREVHLHGLKDLNRGLEQRKVIVAEVGLATDILRSETEAPQPRRVVPHRAALEENLAAVDIANPISITEVLNGDKQGVEERPKGQQQCSDEKQRACSTGPCFSHRQTAPNHVDLSVDSGDGELRSAS